ncbi:PREDICTED: protein RRNAD1 [Nicrophorus vespilloides]|uniref:Protein RRNAD1 n=1 Tax=Nicrophorus vespilloides TaxID=110193 RepID=A0ABM1MNW6_NICVS|nr:PREDICTED: protein RRNAD1 [Nicrophorus vespilloides]
MTYLSRISRGEIEQNLKSAYDVIKEVDYITDTYILDFFVEDVWEKLPKDWRTYLESLSLAELAQLIDATAAIPKEECIPNSLLNVRESVLRCSLSRDFKQYNVLSNSSNFPLFEHLKDGRFESNFFRGVKKKKTYEIMNMSALIYQTTQQIPVDFVVDVGGGVGHLSRVLAYVYNVKVISVDGNKSFITYANKLNDKIALYMKKLKPGVTDLIRPIHICSMVESNITTEEFEKLIQQGTSYGIVGLHPCGDLAPTLLKLFKTSTNCKFINIASCCYMKLSTDQEAENEHLGFPVSEESKEYPIKLSYAARELACHALELYKQKLILGNVEDLKVHSYRALLELLIVEKYPSRRKEQIKSVKYRDGLTFFEYAERALRCSDIQLNLDEADLQSISEKIDQWKRVVIVYSLRLMFAPLIETIILMDRLLYLHNDVGSCDLIPFFDPTISPRTHVLTATK